MPFIAYPIAGVVLGLIFGSFIAAIVVRWPQDQSVIRGRSRCDGCGHQLGAAELIPVLSHVIQRGRCKKCGTEIGSDHLMIELTAALIGGLALYISPGAEGLAGAVFGWLLLALAALDARHHWLPDRLTFSLAITGLSAAIILDQPDLLSRLIGGVAGFLSLFLIAVIYRRLRGRDGLGGGDPKLLGAIGCWLGWATLPLVLLGATFVATIAIIRMRTAGADVTATTALPLGSFMAITAFPLWLIQSALGSPILLQ